MADEKDKVWDLRMAGPVGQDPVGLVDPAAPDVAVVPADAVLAASAPGPSPAS
jgi:hypothetical protein